MKSALVFVCTVLFTSFQFWQTDGEKTKSDLIKEIKKNMSSQLRPVKNASHVINVTLNLAIQHIENIDEKQQTMTIQGFLPLSWNSETIGWNRSAYTDKLTKVMISAFYPWKPNMQVWNSGKGNDPWKYGWSLPAHVYSDGTIYISRYCTFTITCAFDFTWFPYDVQTCPIALSSFEHPLTEVDLNFWSEKPWLRTYWPDSKKRTAIAGWIIRNVSHEKIYWTVEGVTTNLSKIGNTKAARSLVYPIAKFSITIQRHHPYFGITLVLPCFVTAFLCLLSFWIRHIRLALFVLFASLVIIAISLLDLVQKIAPSSGGIPKIVHFYGFNLACTSIALLFRLITFILTYSEEEDQPNQGSQSTKPANPTKPGRKVLESQSKIGTKLFNRMPDYELSFENDLYQPFTRPGVSAGFPPGGFEDNFNPEPSQNDVIENEELPSSDEKVSEKNSGEKEGMGMMTVVDALRYGLFCVFLVAYVLCVIVLLVV